MLKKLKVISKIWEKYEQIFHKINGRIFNPAFIDCRFFKLRSEGSGKGSSSLGEKNDSLDSTFGIILLLLVKDERKSTTVHPASIRVPPITPRSEFQGDRANKNEGGEARTPGDSYVIGNLLVRLLLSQSPWLHVAGKTRQRWIKLVSKKGGIFLLR